MQKTLSSEQLRQELVELSPDFAHDEKNIKQLIDSMLSSAPVIALDPHFQSQLADRLSKHIVWSKESHEVDPKTQARTSRLARFIAYGLPSVALCAVALYTIPRSPTQIVTPIAPSLIESGQIEQIPSSSQVQPSEPQQDIPSSTTTPTIAIQPTSKKTVPKVLPKTSAIPVPQQPKNIQKTTTQDTPSASMLRISPMVADPIVILPEVTPLIISSEGTDTGSIAISATSVTGYSTLPNTEIITGSSTIIDTITGSSLDTGNTLTTTSLSKDIVVLSEQLTSLLNIPVHITIADTLACTYHHKLDCTVPRERSQPAHHKKEIISEIMKTLPYSMIDEKKREKLRDIQ